MITLSFRTVSVDVYPPDVNKFLSEKGRFRTVSVDVYPW